MANPEHCKILKEGGLGRSAWEKWREENPDIKPDLTGADLSVSKLPLWVDLSAANLSGADLRWADLSGQNLSGANLSQADLSAANLSRANLRDVDLRDVDLRDADLSGADLSGQDLSGQNLSRADLSGANLRDVDLRDADLSGADLSGQDLSGQNLSRVDFSGANLKQANLSNSNLSGCDISGANITAANFYNWKIKGIKCTHVIWKNKRIDYENFDDFEKSFTEIESVVEILLDMPFSDLSYYTGRIIQQAFNNKYGEGALIFKGQTATSDDTTKFEFLSDPERDAVIIEKLSELQGQLNPVIEDFKAKSESRSLIRVKDEVDWQDIVFLKFAVLRPNEMKRVLEERYAQMHPFLQTIVQTIMLHIR